MSKMLYWLKTHFENIVCWLAVLFVVSYIVIMIILWSYVLWVYVLPWHERDDWTLNLKPKCDVSYEVGAWYSPDANTIFHMTKEEYQHYCLENNAN